MTLRRRDTILCLSQKEVDYWAKAGIKAHFIPLPSQVGIVGGTDDGYVFSGGRSDRDYATFCKAVENLSITVTIVTGTNPITGKDALDGISIPGNVNVYRNVPQEKFNELLARAKLVILPLEDTPNPVGQRVLVDAMAMSKPIIATSNPGTIDYIVNGYNGILVPVHDVTSLRKQIQWFRR